jgi:hypothetical protein
MTGSQVESLTSEVGRLADEVRVLRDAIDDLRIELEYVTQNREPPPAPFQLTSMPLDPTAPDFHDRVNAVKARDIHNEPLAETGEIRAARQRSFWSSD